MGLDVGASAGLDVGAGAGLDVGAGGEMSLRLSVRVTVTCKR